MSSAQASSHHRCPSGGGVEGAHCEAFPMEDNKEQVIFAPFFERDFNMPAGEFFRGLLYYYKLELVHLIPNSIIVVSSFVYFLRGISGDTTQLFPLAIFLQRQVHRQAHQHGRISYVLPEIRSQGRMDRYGPT
jgi:hypothetical protein